MPKETNVTNSQAPNAVNLYIWDPPEAGGTGHVGIGYIKGSEKTRYHAIWPKENFFGGVVASIFGAAFGMACSSYIEKSLEKDISWEERSPDRTISIPVKESTIHNVDEFMNKRNEMSERGHYLYCLVPKFPLSYRVAQAMASGFPAEPSAHQEIALAKGERLPVDEDDRIIETNLEKITLGHCASEGLNVLAIIAKDEGLPPISENTGLPYVYAPKDIGDLAEGFRGARVLQSKEEPETTPPRHDY